MTVVLALLRRFWPAVPIALLAAALLLTRATLADVRHTLANERAAWSLEIARGETAKQVAEASYARQSATAALSYADRLAAREPIILRSTDTVRTYAQTVAGRAPCLAADRVRGIDALDAALFADDPRSAGGSADAMPTDAGAAPGGRSGDQR